MSNNSNSNEDKKFNLYEAIQKASTFATDSKQIIDNDTYQITDLQLKDFYGDVRETISRTVLYPNKKTRGHAHRDMGEIYHFTNGVGIMFLQTQNDNYVFQVEAESYIYVPKQTWHLVINLGKNENLEFYTIYHGVSERPNFKEYEFEKTDELDSDFVRKEQLKIPPTNFNINKKKKRN